MAQERAAPPNEGFGAKKRRRGGGQPKPRTPSGETRGWERPTGETTPNNRKKDSVEQEV